METHPDPAHALSDGPNAVPLKHMKALLETLVALDRVTKKNGFLEDHFDCPGDSMAPAYIIVDMLITDPDQYKEYMAAAPAKVKAFGGEYLVRGGRFEVLEGDWQPRASRCCAFPATSKPRPSTTARVPQARAKRAGATQCNMVLVEGVDAPV
jgi:uncharacterized protein (DUF1330 family)